MNTKTNRTARLRALLEERARREQAKLTAVPAPVTREQERHPVERALGIEAPSRGYFPLDRDDDKASIGDLFALTLSLESPGPHFLPAAIDGVAEELNLLWAVMFHDVDGVSNEDCERVLTRATYRLQVLAELLRRCSHA